MKFWQYIFIFFSGTFLLPQISFAQNKKDSLSIIDNVNVLNFNYYQNINKNPIKSLNYAKDAFSYFDNIDTNELKFKVASNYVTALFVNDRYKDALLILDKIENLNIKDNNKALYFTLRGLVENDLTQITEAEASYKKALDLYVKLNDTDNQFTILNNLGLLYNNIGDYKKSLKMYLDCYDIVNDLKIKVDRYKYHMNIGTVSNNLNDYKNALSSFKNALNEATNNNESLRVFRAKEKIAQVYLGLNKLDIAGKYYNEALTGYKQLGLKKDACTVLLNLGDIHYQKNDKDTALKKYENAKKIATSNNFEQELYSALLSMASIYKEQLKYSEASSLFKKIIAHKSSITNFATLKDTYKGLYEIEKDKNNTLLSLKYLENYLKYDTLVKENQLITQKEQIETQYTLKQKEHDLEKLEVEFDLNELKLKNKQQQFQGLIILSVLILLVLILLSILYIQNKKSQKLLSLRNKKINSQNEILTATNKEIKAQRKELSNLNKVKDQLLSIIAHDVKSPMTDLYNLLFILRHNVNAVSKDDLKKNLAVIESSTSNLLNLLNNILNWTISQSSGIKVKISSFSLNDLINTNLKLVESSVIAKELRVNFQPEKTLDFIESDLNIVDFALRNILSNAVKFTNKKGNITIETQTTSNHIIEIRIADSGIGFNEEIHDLLKKNTERVPVKTGTNTEKGYGIGLSLCKKMLSKINSKIIYEKNHPSGSIFILQLKHPNLNSHE